MFVKVLTLLIVLAALLWMLRPARRVIVREREVQPPRVPHADDLVTCSRCGIWRPAGQSCDCEARR